MNANAVCLLDLFEKKLRLEVPMFQRQYVWNRGQQWEPLWEDLVHRRVQKIHLCCPDLMRQSEEAWAAGLGAAATDESGECICALVS